MTGFGAGEAVHGGTAARCELRSVNGKGLELRLRLPARLDHLEPDLRREARARLHRGNVQASLALERADEPTGLRIDEAALDRAVATVRAVAERHGLAMPDAGTFLALPGVQSASEPEGDAVKAEAAAVGAAFAKALAALVADRAREGEALHALLAERLDAMDTLAERAAADPSLEPAAIRARLAERVAALGAAEGLDPDRLHAEAALLAVRADVSEEIDRLRGHLAAARELLTGDGPAGRRLDFLVQEMGREANTLCSKSNAASLTAIGLELKLAIDQMREQTANVE